MMPPTIEGRGKSITFLMLLDNYLGHGRMLESALIFVKLQYAAILLVAPTDQVFIVAFSDLHVHTWVLALPFIFCSIPQFIGLALNIMGAPSSRWFRIVGASVGIMVWTFMLFKNIMLGFYAAGINPWMMMAIVGSIIIIRKALLNLPTPGSIGAA